MSTPNKIDRAQLAEQLGPLPDATKRADVELLANAIRALPESAQPFYAHELVHNDLMQFDDPMLRALIERAKQQGVLAQALSNMFTYFPQFATEMVMRAADHCESGVDEWQTGAAGGWSDEEMLTAYACLYVARDGLSIPFGSNVQ